MKKSEILRELPKYEKDTKWANAVGKNDANRFSWHRAATNLQSNLVSLAAPHNLQGILVPWPGI